MKASRRTAKKQREAAPVRHLYAAAHPWCEAQIEGCTGRTEHIHEPLTRGRGGDINDPENMLAVCWRCHAHIHDHPSESTERGWLRRA